MEVSEMLDHMLRKLPSKRDYNVVFGKISEMLMDRYSIAVPALDLRFRFTLFMQEEFDSVPRDQWQLDDPAWIGEKEQKAKDKLVAWIGEQIREKEEKEKQKEREKQKV